MESLESHQVCYHRLHHNCRYAKRSCWCGDQWGVKEVGGAADQHVEGGDTPCDQGEVMRVIAGCETGAGGGLGEIPDDSSQN